MDMIVGKLRKYTRHVAQNYGVTGPTLPRALAERHWVSGLVPQPGHVRPRAATSTAPWVGPIAPGLQAPSFGQVWIIAL